MPRLAEDVASDESESIGSDIPAQPIEDTKAPDEQVNGELQEKVEEEAEPNEDDGEGEGEASEQEEGVYEVEAIRSHRFQKSKLLMVVKWKGYPEDQNTEESEEMLENGASEVLSNYFQELGGRPEPPSKLGKRKSTSQLKAASDSPMPKRPKRTNGKDDGSADEITPKTGSWIPDKKNWESDIASVDTVERDRETGKLWAFINFNNGKRSKVGMERVYKHCPIVMLKFYERHLSVSPTPEKSLVIILPPSPSSLARRKTHREHRS